MLRVAIAGVGLFLFLGLILTYTGYVVVRDETGLAVEARVVNGEQDQILSPLPFGYFIGIPRVEGEIWVYCSDGSSVRGGYVTRHWRETVTVVGDGTCEKLFQ